MGEGVEGWEKGTISIALVHEALQVYQERNHDVTGLLEQVSIPPALLATPRARVSAESYARLWFLTAQAMDDEFFGMDRHPMRVGAFALLCHSVLSGPTLGKALKRALDFFHLVLDDLHGSLSVEGDRARITLHDRAGPNRMFAYCTFLIILHGLSCWLVGRRLPILSAGFRCAEPTDTTDYCVRFCERLAFDQLETSITFDAAVLGLRVIQDEKSLREFLRGAPANLLVKYRNDDSLTAKVRKLLRAPPPADWPDLQALAHELNLTVSTLRRRLEDEGQTDQQIKDVLRCDLAIASLSQGGDSVFEIASQLGFADASAFHRAFKKWTGRTPAAYRRDLRGLDIDSDELIDEP
jgi:AraC-like DNA-binding protein